MSEAMLKPVNPAFACLQAQTGAALDVLAFATPGDDGVHAARKALKKARSALRLLRPALGDEDYRQTNIALRDAGRGLSPLRDARVLQQLYSALTAEGAGDSPPAGPDAAVREALAADMSAARAALAGSEARRRAAGLIEGSRQLLARQALAEAGVAVLDRGLRRIYRRARAAFACARADGGTAALHEWRKQAKYLRNAAALLRGAHAAGLRKVEKRAAAIGEALGVDHDLAVLDDLMCRAPLPGGAAREALRQRIGERRAQLQKAAFVAGARLFAGKPKRFMAAVRIELGA